MLRARPTPRPTRRLRTLFVLGRLAVAAVSTATFMSLAAAYASTH